jgi:hypothetical protein
MVECVVGVSVSGEKLSDLGLQRFCFDAESEGVGCNIRKEKKLSPFWARRAKAEVERAVQRFLAGLLELGFSCGGPSRKHWPSFGKLSGYSFQLKPKTKFLFKPNKPFSEVVLTGQGLMGPKPQPGASSSLMLQTKTQCVPPETVLSQAIPSQSWKDVSGSTSSKAAKLGDRLCFSLPMMSESETPIYPSDSKKLLRYSQKLKDAKMNENLIAEAVAALNVPPLSLGPHSSLAPAPFHDEV